MSDAVRAFMTSAIISTVSRVRWSETERDGLQVAWVITCASPAVMGRSTVKREPAPDSLSAMISPPCHSTMLFEMLSPRPTPGYSRESELSIW